MFKSKKEITSPSEKSKKKYKVKKVEKGDEFYTYDGYLNHVIDVIDDEGTPVIVYRCWLKYKNRWGYYCEPLAHHLYSQCCLNDLPDKQRKELFDINNVDSKHWL